MNNNWYVISNEGIRERELDFSTLRAGGIALKFSSVKIQDGHTFESPVFGAQREERGLPNKRTFEDPMFKSISMMSS